MTMNQLVYKRQFASMKGGTNKQEDNAPINDFNGHYQFLNNDHPAWVLLDGQLYPSASIAYQASRTSTRSIRHQLQQVETYQQFKQISLNIQNPSDWNNRKEKVMQKLIRDKFKRTKELGNKLVATHPRTLVNSFKKGGQSQMFWGVVQGRGTNTLGKILMSIREEMRKGADWQKWVSDQGTEVNPKLRPQVCIIVSKDNKPIEKLFLEKRSKFFFGSFDKSDFKLDHPSISKMHASIYFGEDQNVMLVDLGSSNGTTLTRGDTVIKLQNFRAFSLQTGDVITFGLSTRTYRIEIDDRAVKQYLEEKRQARTKEMGMSEEKKEGKRKSRSRSRSRSPKRKGRDK